MPANHPTLLAAHELGIDVFEPAQAFDRLLALPAKVRPRPMPLPVASTPLITVTVLVLVGVLALLGFFGVLASESPPETTTVRQITEGR